MGQRLCKYPENPVLDLIYTFANAFGNLAERKANWKVEMWTRRKRRGPQKSLPLS